MNIIFDVDGTLMDIETRRKFLDETPPNWDKFMDPSEMQTDKPMEHVFNLAACLYDSGHQIVVVSARNERHREVTESQLKTAGGEFWSHMFLRPDDSYEPDHEFKQRVLNELIKADWKPDMIFDDRNSVVDMWRSNGIPCLQVAEGNF